MTATRKTTGAKKAPVKATTAAKKAVAPKATTAKKATAPKPDPQAAAALTARVQAARTAGFTCRSIARLALPGAAEGSPDTPVWKLAGACDRISHGGTATAEQVAAIVPVLNKIERGEVQPPEKPVRQTTSKRAAAIAALQTAMTEKSIAGTRKLVQEALDLLA
jgi:hypothetical protein